MKKFSVKTLPWVLVNLLLMVKFLSLEFWLSAQDAAVDSPNNFQLIDIWAKYELPIILIIVLVNFIWFFFVVRQKPNEKRRSLIVGYTVCTLWLISILIKREAFWMVIFFAFVYLFRKF